VPSAAELQVIIRGQDELSGKLTAINGGLSGLGAKMQEVGGHAGILGGALGTALGVFTGGAVLGAVSSGFGALSNFIKGGIADAKDANVIFAQSEAVIKSTGGAAGVSAQQVADYASSLSAASGKSLFGDDQIAQSENLLLTFTNIKGKALEAATSMSVDMAQAMGGAPKDAAIQLGKALNDPIAGISALSRVGVTFDDQQKKNIATMMKHGDVAGAQGVILAELNKEFGGSAAAAAKADGGFAQFKDRMGELGESIGHQLEPVTRAFFAFLGGPGAAAIERFAGFITNTVFPAIGRLAAVVKDVWGDIVDGFNDGGVLGAVRNGFGRIWDIARPLLVAFGASVVAWITAEIPILAAQFLAWGRAFIAWVVPAIPPALAALGQLIVSIGAWAAAQVSVIAGRLLAWGQAFIAWVGPMIPPALAALGQFITSLGAWVVAQVPVLIGQLAAWGRSFVAWVEPMIPPALAALDGMAASLLAWIAAKAAPILAQLQTWAQSLVAWIGPAASDFLARWPGILNSFLNWIAGAAAPILSRLGDWARSFIAWIVPATVNFLQQWPGMLNQFLDWIGNAAGPLLVKLGEWALAFIKWIAPMIPPFLVALAGVAAAIVIFVAETAAVLVGKLVQWGAAFLGFVGREVLPKLPGALASIVSTIVGWIATAAGTLAGEAAKIGDGIINGIKGAIGRGVGALADAVRNAAQAALNAAKNLLGIHSPSTVFADEVGQWIPKGIAQGILDNAHVIPQALGSLNFGVRQPAYAGMAGLPSMSAPIIAPALFPDRGGVTIGAVNVYPAPGMDERALADLVVQRIDQRSRTRR
jgi:hypothetical protein